jgi:hypothetical protein
MTPSAAAAAVNEPKLSSLAEGFLEMLCGYDVVVMNFKDLLVRTALHKHSSQAYNTHTHTHAHICKVCNNGGASSKLLRLLACCYFK